MSITLITQGESAGIGPDLIIKSQNYLNECIVIGDLNTFIERSKVLNLKINFNILTLSTLNSYLNNLKQIPNDKVNFFNFQLPYKSKAGTLNLKNQPHYLKLLDFTINLIKKYPKNNLINLPISKQNIKDNFKGHTTYLQELFGKTLLMSFISPQTIIALASEHISLKSVPNYLNYKIVFSAIQILIRHIKKLAKINNISLLPNLNQPIAISALNPHCGEKGILGTEEQDFIIKAIKNINNNINNPNNTNNKANVIGPLSADSLFSQKNLKKYSAFLTMYHDQGLIPAKILAELNNYQCANLTLNLPFWRLSPSHGIALDIAGTGKANINSFLYCLKLSKLLKNI